MPQEETNLRVARVPTRLKQNYRKDNATGCMKVLAEWVFGTLDAEDLAKPALAATRAQALLKDVLGPRALDRDVVGPRIGTELGKVADKARKMQRETPLTEEDLAFIQQGPSDTLELTGALIDRKQPRWLMGWRDITNATNERTVVGGILPRMGIGNNLPIWHPTYDLGAKYIAAFIAQLSSTQLDYAARQKVAGTHLNFSMRSNFPSSAPTNTHATTSPLSRRAFWN